MSAENEMPLLLWNGGSTRQEAPEKAFNHRGIWWYKKNQHTSIIRMAGHTKPATTAATSASPTTTPFTITTTITGGWWSSTTMSKFNLNSDFRSKLMRMKWRRHNKLYKLKEKGRYSSIIKFSHPQTTAVKVIAISAPHCIFRIPSILKLHEQNQKSVI